MDKILFFDGVCVMCNGFVGFALTHDTKRRFKFAPLQGLAAKNYIPEVVSAELSTVVLWDQGKIHTESDAIIRLLIGLGGILRLAAIFYICPKFIRDRIYRFVARNRYRWFGTTESCSLLSVEERKQLLQ